MSDLERAITGYSPQIYTGVYQGYRVILWAMFARLYIEARLVNPEAADVVWEAWHSGAITTYKAAWAWWATASRPEAVVEMIDYWQAADDPKQTLLVTY